MLKPPPQVTAGSAAGRLELRQKSNGFNLLGSEFKALLAREAGVLGRGHRRPADVPSGSRSPGDLEPAVPGLQPARRLGAGAAETQEEALDPLTRSLAGAFMAGPAVSAGPVSAPSPVVTTAGHAMAEFAAIEEAVRRVSWGGDRRRGVARIELGGEHAGTAIVVHGDAGSVGLSVHGAAGAATGELAERLLERLRARGLDVSRVEVR